MSSLIIPSIEDLITNYKEDIDYCFIKELEELILNYYTGKNNLTNVDNFILLKNIKDMNFIKTYKEINIKYLIELYNLNKTISNNIENNIENIVFTGSIIRSMLINKPLDDSFKKELFINCINIDPSSLIDSNFKSNEFMYYLNKDDYNLCIFKKVFTTQSEAILRNPVLKRFGLYNNIIYSSYSFIIDYYKNLDIISSEIYEPIFKTPLDIFDIYKFENKNNLKDVFDLIGLKDYELFIKNKKLIHDTIKNNLTPIEYAISLYLESQNDIIKDNLNKIIIELHTYNFMRNHCFYCKIHKLDEFNADLFDTITQNKEYDKILDFGINNRLNISNLHDVNNLYLEYYISLDNYDAFYNYLKYINLQIDNNIVNYIIRKIPKNIILQGIKNNIFEDKYIYKIILITQELDYFGLINDFSLPYSLNYLNDIINLNLTKSLYFLYNIDKDIIRTIDDENNNLLHKVSEKQNDYIELIKLLLKLDDSLIFNKNKNGQNPLMYHIEKNNLNITEFLIEYINLNCDIVYETTDLNYNTILHYLCKKDTFYIIKKLLSNEIILKQLNKQNKKKYTPIITAALYKQEELIYLLKSYNADLNITDIFGNTVYHYICYNSLCLGMTIPNIDNNFYYTPKDYLRISDKYYYFLIN